MREPAVAGQFYPDDPDELSDMIKECYEHELGPSMLPGKPVKGKRSIKGLVVPHAGLPYSGPCASHAYLELFKDGMPDTFIILGPNHHGVGASVATMTEDWDMPFGKALVDRQLAKLLTTGVVKADDMAHHYEHSIEVQIPFLQKLKSDLKFVPITMARQDFATAKEVGETMAQAVAGKNVVIIAASDFSHVGSNFSVPVPTGKNAGQYAAAQDSIAIKEILAMNPQGLVEKVKQHGITMCGYGPVAAMMICARKMGATKAKLLKYYSSYDVMPATSAVGYAAIVLE